VAVDSMNNENRISFPVTVQGECGADCLQLACPPGPLVVEANANGLAMVRLPVSATNICGGDAWVKCVPESGSAFPVGTNSVGCSSGIGDLLLQRCFFEVVVKDVTPPAIHTRFQGMSVFCQGLFPQEGGAGAYVNFNGISVSDNADPNPTVVFNPPSGSFFKLGAHTIVCTATDASGNQSTVDFFLTVKSGPACEVQVITNGVDQTENWDFELGLRTWTRTGTAFANQPTVGDNVHVIRIPELKAQLEQTIGGDYWHELEYPIGYHAEHWIGTAENHADDSTLPGTMLGDDATGTLLSKSFKVEQRYITFLIGGQRDPDQLRVELLVHAQAGEPDAINIAGLWYRVVKSATGHGEERMRRASFDAEEVMGQIGRLRIVDNSTTGHLNVDDFRFQPSPPHVTLVKVGETERPSTVIFNGLEYDWDSPVWGLADLHTHPMAHLGLGQLVFHGQPDGDIKLSLTNCNCFHGGPGPDNLCGNYLRQLALTAFDEEGADHHQFGWDYNQWKRFQRWPIFTSYSHQQMWYEWVQRAYNGGLRVMVALTVHNKLLAKAMLGSHGAIDDYSVMTNQIAQLKEFVARHDDFMEIAYDPFQLREIVRNNKLAIIIGSETDDIGNFDRNPAVSELGDPLSRVLVKQKLQELHDLGLRYIFPVHLTDNKFGGTAVYNPLFAVGTKYYMGRPLYVEGVSNGIRYKLPSLDATDYLPSADQIVGKMFEAIANPFAPLQLMLDVNGQVMGSPNDVSDSSIGLGAVGAIATLPMIVSAGIVAAPVLTDFFGDFNSLNLPTDIYPLGNNYPPYALVGTNYSGHRNTNGLSTLGEFALKEMMKLGMMIDLDHMGERGVSNALAIAEQIPCGYPVNSGHNSFRALRYDASENNRTAQQLARIRNLGGLMGLGWGNGDFKYASEGLGHVPTNSSSFVGNDCPGSSKTFAQSAIYALEHMQRRRISLGSDINGFVVGPGPRFGPQSAHGLREEALAMRSQFIGNQENGLAYEPREGRPGTTGVFNGRGVDPSTDDGFPHLSQGYRYNKQQRDFFVALRIFRWGWQKTPKMTADDVQEIIDNLNHNSYDWDRVKEFARGLLLGPTNGDPGTDFGDPDVNVKQKLAKAVYRRKVLGEAPPDEIVNDSHKYDRYKFFIKVWEDYENIYGQNTPMKRCETHLVQWDYNFDGLAHYGLLPDFFQDLGNVGLNADDMSPLFRSAEDFAQMWTKCLCAAYAMNHPYLTGRTSSAVFNGLLTLEWYAEEGDQLEETDQLGERAAWRRSDVPIQIENGRAHAVVRLDSGMPKRFFRVRKP
jgi:microsomal dipeptidase-like Zn-dependent dipeptidase